MSNYQTKPCRFYGAGKQCRFGSSCKFLHSDANPGATAFRPQQSSAFDGFRSNVWERNKPVNSSQNRHHEWRRLLSREPSTTQQIRLFLSTGLQMLSSPECDLQQSVVRDLGEDRGLRWIKSLVEMNYTTDVQPLEAFGYGIGELDFKMHCLPLLQLLSHSALLSSLVLEKHVGTIYNVVYGLPSSPRCIPFFQSVAENIDSAFEQNEQELAEQALMAASTVVLQTISLNQEAVLQPALKDITRSMFSSCSALRQGSAAGFAVRKAETSIQRIKERLQMAENLPSVRQKIGIEAMPAFRLEQDLPGNFSVHGQRHDNDHARIEEISVLPTTSELRCERSPFLPLKSQAATHHEQGVYRLLDSQFRLLREDTAGLLRDAVTELVEQWDVLVESHDKARKHRAMRNLDVKMSLFSNVQVEGFRFPQKRGLLVDLSFSQPPALETSTLRERVQYWEAGGGSRNLLPGSLLTLVDQDLESTFMLVEERNARKGGTQLDEFGDPIPQKGVRDLAGNSERALISLRLAMPTEKADQERLLRLARKVEAGTAVLVEFPGMLFASFEPVLKCLQELHKQPRLPFIDWIAPAVDKEFTANEMDDEDKIKTVAVPPPLYLTTGMTLDLTCISKNRHPMSHSVAKPVTVEELQKHTTMDHGQCESLLLSLKNELALVQGPPGTGKTYLGIQIAKVLLANQKKLKLGPIVCVCYTNHALDQFLEQILDQGEDRIIRIGSRSKSERLQSRTLAAVRGGIEKTQIEKKQIWDSLKKLEEAEEEMDAVLARLSGPNTALDLSLYLSKEHPEWQASLFVSSVGEDGWQVVTHGRLTKTALLQRWIDGKPHPHRNESRRPYIPARHGDRQLPQLLRVARDLWDLSQRERLRLHLHWQSEIDNDLLQILHASVDKFNTNNHTLKCQYKETDKRALTQAAVIGATTTGLASNSELLRSLPAKVLIIEEAAEVLEAHTITAFLPSIEHAILIGDHLQLRATVSKYELSMESAQGKKYGLDESLFERLMREKFGPEKLAMPFSTLDVQRRMHPSISTLIRNTLYPGLRDHGDPAQYPEVAGMRRRLAWLDHRNREDAASGDHLQTSKTNAWEAEMVVALVRHLSRQGEYGKGEVAVLTPYLGQLRVLRKMFEGVTDLVIGEKDLEDVLAEEEEEDEEKVEWRMNRPRMEVQRGRFMDGLRLATVDNFQGEEAKVIIVSLVRSNPELKCGFLKTSNRINVLLSRAQHGMYIIGDTETSSGVPMWSQVIGMLKSAGSLGPDLELMCPRHPERMISVSTPNDFVEFAPEGGCSVQCGKRLNCGHTCIVKCHSAPLHEVVKCYEDCSKTFKHCDHLCPKRCYEDCGTCQVKITETIQLPCGHTSSSLTCHETLDLASVKCRQRIRKIVPVCEHEIEQACHITVRRNDCKELCNANLPCGHKCIRKCRDCKKPDPDNLGDIKIDHGTCEVACGRAFSTCNHSCKMPCHPDTPCAPCTRRCEVRCVHSQCAKLCSEPCPPCAEPCLWACPHRKETCSMPCCVPCDILPCSRRCEKQLSCGHQCPSICGESCPPISFCQECATPEVKERQVDMILFSTYAEADLDDDPVVFFDCNHFYTRSTLDGIMDMSSAYEVEPDGTLKAPLPISNATIKSCPECRAPVRNINRYNRITKSALLSEATRRFIASTMAKLGTLRSRITVIESSFENRAARFAEQLSGRLMASSTAALENFKKDYRGMKKELDRFIESVDEDEQPYGRVRSLVLTARRRGDGASYEVDNTAIQHGNLLRGRSLKLQAVWAGLWAYQGMLKNLDGKDDVRVAHEWKNFLRGEIHTARTLADKLEEEAKDKSHLREEIEAVVYGAMLVALHLAEPRATPVLADNNNDQLAMARAPEERDRKAALDHELGNLTRCEDMLMESIKDLREDIEKAKTLLNGGKFYSFVTSEEKQQVYEAMQKNFWGTGHWYTCQNGHPFTIGECGQPMEEARCPECEARIGGRSHQAVEGVQHDGEFERQFGQMRV